MRIQIPPSALQPPAPAPALLAEPPPLDPMDMDFGLPPGAPLEQPVQQPAYLAPTNAPRRTLNQQGKKRKRKKTPAAENDWSCVGWGVGLLIVAFVSAGMPGMDEMGRGGRGITKLIARLLFMLGPYAPLVGILVGLGGIALIIYGLKRVPKVASLIAGGFVSLMLIVVCGLSFMNAMGMLQVGNQNNGVASNNVGPPSFGPPERHSITRERHAVERESRRSEMREEQDLRNAVVEIAGRSIRGGDHVVPGHFNFSKATTPLKFGDLAGHRSGFQRIDAYYSDQPINGVVFGLDGIATHIALSEPNESGLVATSKQDGEAVHGFNLNFDGHKLIGIQAMFGKLRGGSIDTSSLRKGKWIGESADTFEFVTGNGQPVYGFAVHKEHGFDIVGFQLVIKR